MAGGRDRSVAAEGFAAVEFMQLVADPLFYGIGAPRGDGRLALVLPGLFANDWYLWPLRAWLGRVGFRPVRSALRVNAGCPERLCGVIEEELARRRRTAPGPVVLIGHSRGGMLARAIAARLQEDASHLVLLGSPVGLLSRTREWSVSSVAASPATSRVAEQSIRARQRLDPDCNVPVCGCPFPTDFARPLSAHTKVASIYSRNDPIVPAGAAMLPEGENIELGGTHSGLVYNRAMYRELARLLR